MPQTGRRATHLVHSGPLTGFVPQTETSEREHVKGDLLWPRGFLARNLCYLKLVWVLVFNESLQTTILSEDWGKLATHAAHTQSNNSPTLWDLLSSGQNLLFQSVTRVGSKLTQPVKTSTDHTHTANLSICKYVTGRRYDSTPSDLRSCVRLRLPLGPLHGAGLDRPFGHGIVGHLGHTINDNYVPTVRETGNETYCTGRETYCTGSGMSCTGGETYRTGSEHNTQ